MNRGHFKLFFIGFLALLSAACIHHRQDNPVSTVPFNIRIDAPPTAISDRQLQAEVMAFSDQYVMIFWQAMDELYRADLPAEKKLAVEYAKLLYTSSAISIAAQPSPVASLLDMITFIRLGHIAVTKHWVPVVYGTVGEPLLHAYQRLEEDVWKMAALVLSDDQQNEVREIIDRWQREHPNQWYVSDIHIQSFSSARGRPVHPLSNDAQGLLSSVSQSLHKVDEALMVADRALFLGERMPRLMTLQTELLVSQFTENPLINRMVNDFRALQETTAHLGNVVEEFPRNISAERMATLQHIEELLQRERTAWLAAFNDNDKKINELMAGGQTTLELAAKTAQSYNTLIESLQKLSGDEDGDTLREAVTLADKTHRAGEEFNLLVTNLERFISTGNVDTLEPRVRQMLQTLKQEEEKLIDRAFILAAVLILLALAGALFVALAYRYIADRLFQKKLT